MIDFDIEKVKKQDDTNPVYYVQYAHARICSILRKGAGVTAEEAEKLGMDEVARRAVGEEYDLSLLTDPTEADACPQALGVSGAGRGLRARSRPLPPHSLRRGAGR